jgi:hypothetical protein
MEPDIAQLKRNRAKVFLIAAGLFLLGSQGHHLGSLVGHHEWSHHENADIDVDRIEAAAEHAADLADRAVQLADRAAEAADRAAERR